MNVLCTHASNKGQIQAKKQARYGVPIGTFSDIPQKAIGVGKISVKSKKLQPSGDKPTLKKKKNILAQSLTKNSRILA